MHKSTVKVKYKTNLLLFLPLLLLLLLPLLLNIVTGYHIFHHPLPPTGFSGPSNDIVLQTLESVAALDFLFEPRKLGTNIFRRKTPLSMLSLRDILLGLLLYFFFCFLLTTLVPKFMLMLMLMLVLSSSSLCCTSCMVCCSSTISLRESSYEDSGMFSTISRSSLLAFIIACNRDVGDGQMWCRFFCKSEVGFSCWIFTFLDQKGGE